MSLTSYIGSNIQIEEKGFEKMAVEGEIFVGQPGFNFMRDEDNKVIYVGESNNVRKRLIRHYKGRSSSPKLFKHLFYKVVVFHYCPS